MIYTKNNAKKGEPLPSLPEDFWTLEEFKHNFDYHTQRRLLCRDFNIFKRRENNHVGLIGTKYNFYVKMWMFGYSKPIGLYENGREKYAMVYFPFESLFEMDEVPDKTREMLAYHLHFFAYKDKV